jgi:hypothetical protein
MMNFTYVNWNMTRARPANTPTMRADSGSSDVNPLSERVTDARQVVITKIEIYRYFTERLRSGGDIALGCENTMLVHQ